MYLKVTCSPCLGMFNCCSTINKYLVGKVQGLLIVILLKDYWNVLVNTIDNCNA